MNDKAPPEQKAAIHKDLDEWKKYCSDWASAYRNAAQSALQRNSQLVVIAIVASAVVAAVGGSAPLSGLSVLGYVSAVLGVVTATVNGLQKSTFASVEQAKQYHITAAAYESAKRDIEVALTSTDVEDLKKQRDAVKTQLNATDTQAPELPKRYKPLDPTRGSSSGGE